MTTPIDMAIDAACVCLKCGSSARIGSCGCWVSLECPNCGKSRLVDREPGDDPMLARVIYPCTDCDDHSVDPIHLGPDGTALSLCGAFKGDEI